MNNKRSVFGWIFMLVGLAFFFVFAANSIGAELHDVLHQAPAGGDLRKANAPAIVNKTMEAVLPPTVADLPHFKAVNPASKSTNDDPFMQFSIVTWLGWSFVIAALAEVGRAYLVTQKTRVEE
jgi:hypothetical protein